MSICIPAATNEGMSAQAFGHFGSAPYFVIHNPASGATEVLENTNAHHAHGGCQPLAALQGRDVDVLIVGGIGAHAIQHLNSTGIKVYRAEEGTVTDNIDRLADGSLTEITPAAGCAGHHGAGHDCG